MAKKKKNRKAIAKRKERSKQKRKRKSKSTRINLASSQPRISYESRPAISDIETPEGFRSISMSQAMMEFSQPLMEYLEQGVVDEINDVFEIGMGLWNYALNLEGVDNQQIKNELLKQIQTTLELSEIETWNLFNEMIERKSYLFPPDIQPKNPMIMFIRKEGEYEIRPFDYTKLNYSDSPILADETDIELIVSINQMDAYIIEGAEYDEWESHFFKMQEDCSERYKNWLKGKGLEDYFAEEFPYCIGIYLNFIYQYGHDHDIILKTITEDYLEEFFGDFLLRKVLVKPHEYTQWPPAIKLFYQFLGEKGYDSKLEKLITLVDNIEPIFIEILRERY